MKRYREQKREQMSSVQCEGRGDQRERAPGHQLLLLVGCVATATQRQAGRRKDVERVILEVLVDERQ